MTASKPAPAPAAPRIDPDATPAAGGRWRRTATGELVPVPDEPATTDTPAAADDSKE